jgi:hypothetical protein
MTKSADSYKQASSEGRGVEETLKKSPSVEESG